jgi:glucose/arabinose dehydrogenase
MKVMKIDLASGTRRPLRLLMVLAIALSCDQPSTVEERVIAPERAREQVEGPVLRPGSGRPNVTPTNEKPVAHRTNATGPSFRNTRTARPDAQDLPLNSAVLAGTSALVSHILWQNLDSGVRGFWPMSGTTYTGGWDELGGVSTDWDIAAIGDFAGDASYDVVWQNKTTGSRGVWPMIGTAYSGGWESLGTIAPEWDIAGVADFNSDGRNDILWQNRTTGTRGIWTMFGTTMVTWYSLGFVPLEWDIAGAGDFTNDNKPDIVWQNLTTGTRGIWPMNGTAYAGGWHSIGYVPVEWRIGAVGDFTGDNNLDWLWQNMTTGARGIWPMSGTTYQGGWASLGDVPPAWNIAGLLSPLGTIRLAVAVSGLRNPLHLTAPLGDPRLFIVEQAGLIRIVENGQLLSTPFLDITSNVLSGGEQGLFSVAFDPNYSSNGYFYVNYTDRMGDTKVERYRVSSDRNVADPASASLVVAVDQPQPNHNGGHILFGPDGMLYIAMGDGGGVGDAANNAQDRATVLGDLLRIDVRTASGYAIPADNPYVGQTGIRGEIWAYGLRNPWRIAIDRVGGHLYIADVGQDAREEINVVSLTTGGVNYGWRIMEGTLCFNPSSCTSTGTLPVLEYRHTDVDGCSITGGLVYRGRRLTAIYGHYFYADYCRGWIRSFRYTGGQAVDLQSWSLGSIGNITSFGEDAEGEMYVMSKGGAVYRFTR